MLMGLERISVNCEYCGYGYCYVIEVDNDELHNSLSAMKHKCRSCGKTVNAIVDKLKPPYFTVNNNAVSFIDNTILQMDGDNIIFDLNAFVSLGFSGTFCICTPEGNKKITINPVFKKVDKLKINNEMSNSSATHIENVESESRRRLTQSELGLMNSQRAIDTVMQSMHDSTPVIFQRNVFTSQSERASRRRRDV